MSESPSFVVEALEALHTDLSHQLEAARVAAAGLLAAERTPRGASPVAHSQWRRALITESTTASVLRGVVEELEEILGEYDERVRCDNPAGTHGVVHSAPVQGDGSPEPS